ncbi:MAG: cytochrome c oxidase subunit II [Candidatus Limnocylindria bacterium]
MRRFAAGTRVRSVLRVAVPLVLIFLLGGCLMPPTPETTQARDVFNLYILVLALGAVVFVAVEGMIVYSIFRYRRRDDRLPRQIHGNTVVEIIWTAIPTVIVLVLFTFSTLTLARTEAKAQNPLTIEVDGFQWQWTFRYLDANYTVTGTPNNPPVMGLPVNQPIRLILKSNDVIHSFYVPHFLVKRDVIPFPPGQPLNQLEFTVTDEGTYAGQCAEFCGDLHARMTFTVQAMSNAKYQQWLADAKAGKSPPPAASVAPGAAEAKLVAKGIAFDQQKLEVPANRAFSLILDNQDTVQHNVSISKGQQVLFRGELVAGGRSVKYQVPALPPGDYVFQCDVHPVPAMTGTITAK